MTGIGTGGGRTDGEAMERRRCVRRTGGCAAASGPSRGHPVRLVGGALLSAAVAACSGIGEPDNEAPTARITAPPDDASFHRGELIAFQGLAADPEEGALAGEALVWSSDRDGRIGTGGSFSRGDLSVGTHTISLTATDGRGASGTARVTLTVEDNDAPTPTITFPSDGASFARGQAILFEGSATDPEDGTLTGDALVWASSQEGQIGTGPSLSRSDLSVGEHAVTLTATDSRGATGTARVTMTVEENAAPSVSISSPPDDSDFVEGTAIAFEGSATDPEDGSLAGAALVWTSGLDGQIGTGSSFDRDDLSRGRHTITLTATDSNGATGTAAIEVVVTSAANQAPSASISRPGAGAIFDAGTSITFQGSGSDPEDGALPEGSLAWSSSLDGPFGTGTSFTFGGLSVGTHEITLKVTDSEGASATATVTVGVYTPSNPAGYDIVVIYTAGTTPTASQRQAFEDAARRWGELITGDVADQIFTSGSFVCSGVRVPAFDDRIDDLVIFARFTHIDGPGGVLGQAGPCGFRSGTLMPALGAMEFDVDDLASIEGLGLLEATILHEMGHVLGFGILWDATGLLVNPADPAAGITRVLAAEADATLSDHFADQNFGLPGGDAASESIVAGANLGAWTSGPADEVLMGLLRFGLGSVPAGFDLSLALLELEVRGRAGTQARTVEVSRVTSAWTEAGVTWNTRPSRSSPPLFSYSHLNCNPGCVLDLTDMAADWLSGAAENHGLALFAPSAETTPDFHVGYHSRHSGSSRQRPRLTLMPDTHFDGPAAIRAFDDAGGGSYGAAKVPVENNVVRFGRGSLDGHWREAVFVNELMSPALNTDSSNPLSAISVESMGDIGYEVDAAAADPFSLGGLFAEGGAAARIGGDRGLLLLDDVRVGPTFLIEPDGGVREWELPLPGRSGGGRGSGRERVWPDADGRTR